MGYVDRNMLAGEDVPLSPGHHAVRFLPGTVGVVLGGLVAIAFRAFVDSFGEFAITSVSIVRKTGILTRPFSQIPLDEAQDRSEVATLWGRGLSYGDAEVRSAAEGRPVAFRRIRNPEAFRNVVLARRAAPAVASGATTPRPRSAEERPAYVERLFRAGTLSEGQHAEKREELIREL